MPSYVELRLQLQLQLQLHDVHDSARLRLCLGLKMMRHKLVSRLKLEASYAPYAPYDCIDNAAWTLSSDDDDDVDGGSGDGA